MSGIISYAGTDIESKTSIWGFIIDHSLKSTGPVVMFWGNVTGSLYFSITADSSVLRRLRHKIMKNYELDTSLFCRVRQEYNEFLIMEKLKGKLHARS